VRDCGRFSGSFPHDLVTVGRFHDLFDIARRVASPDDLRSTKSFQLDTAAAASRP